ncbi:Trafficking protein particle complex subunit 31 [Hypoxylon texense]
MFLARMAMLAVALAGLFSLATATSLLPAERAQVSTNSSDNVQKAAIAAIAAMPIVNHLDKRDDSVHGCHNPTDEFGPAPSVEDCTAAIKQSQTRQEDITLLFNLGCVHSVSGNCTASVCPQLEGTSTISPSEAAQYMTETILPECVAKGSRGWYMDRSKGAGIYLH